MSDKRERAMRAIEAIERRALILASKPRRRVAARTTDLRIIERQLAVLVLAVEAAYRQNGGAPDQSGGSSPGP